MRDVFPATVLLSALLTGGAFATPVNKAGLERHYDKFLGAGLNRCATCHQPSDKKDPQSLDEFPHNAFGTRLRVLGEELEAAGKKKDIATRLTLIANEDSDGDGVDNETELLAGGHPGDKDRVPTLPADFATRREEFKKMLVAYRWQPFERVQRPPVPTVKNAGWGRNAVDAFIATEHEAQRLKPRPEAPREVLLRRVHLDLTGIAPTPEEQRAFAEDKSPDAYEKVVERLLANPRHGERWGRHWMDVWRYSDWAGWTDGKQVRDSQRHIWRWRDWIVESLNTDRAYDKMVTEMLAADELAPDDPATLRATGFLVRNYKMLSREQWLEDTVKHTAQAFLGVTLGCAKCHDHRTDPISQAEYYQVRAIFEPHQVRTDRVPGEIDLEKNGLVRVYDAEKPAPTYFFNRGNEQQPDKDRVMQPAALRVLSGKLSAALDVQPVPLPRVASHPDRREFVVKDLITASEQTVADARAALAKSNADATAKTGAKPPAERSPILEQELALKLAEAKHGALVAVLAAQKLEDANKVGTDEWKMIARDTVVKQRAQAVAEKRHALYKTRLAEIGAKDIAAAKKKTAEAESSLVNAEKEAAGALGTQYTPRKGEDNYPAKSTGRRTAFAKWVASADNPLTARVAVNHLWLRHFGRGIVSTPENFGASGARPSHPALLDWLAAEFMEHGWSMKHMHRLIVTSATYRMASTPDSANAEIDPDNIALWRMPSRRMEAEIVRDNILAAAGSLDATMGGPDIDCAQGLASPRRSIYLRSAAEKEVEFLKIFDGPSVNECYQRRPSVMPQQALALANSDLGIAQSKVLAKKLDGDDLKFANAACALILARKPTADELSACASFLQGKPAAAREQLVLVLFSHNDFVTIR